MFEDSSLIGVALAAGLALTLYHFAKPRKTPPLAPGPKGLPLLGNLLEYPQTQVWVTFSKWAKEYGPIVHLNVLGTTIIVLNDVTYATEMFERKSRIYSGRPTLVMGGELVGWDQGPALIQPGKQWSEYRRLMAQFMGTRSKVEASYGHILEQTTHEFLRGITHSPDAWREHAQRFAGAIVLAITFGYKAKDEDDPLVKLGDDAMSQFSEATAPNAFAVDVFPILRFIPEWFPGASWKKKVEPYRQTLQDLMNTPFIWVKERMKEGVATPCFVSDLLEAASSDEHSIKWAAAGIYSGGADTTTVAIHILLLALVMHPDAQRKAQEELEHVVGQGVAPRLGDLSRLPYLEALLLETLRYYTFGPVGLPHVATEDDVHKGYFIPKGAVIIPNNRLFYRDSNTYSDPETFSPERFIETPTHAKERDPRDILFGYGRRACPGVHLANASMWIVFASILAFFDVSPAIEDGKPVLPSGKFLDGVISFPEQFECTIRPRSGAEEAIHRLVEGSTC
ncbi:cytochrome P450 [Mycena filopes]|nr:cytochrome P450 [Mycena filopes]